MCHAIWNLADKISSQPVNSFRNLCSEQLINKLYSIGLIKTKRLKKCNQVNVKALCRRRLPVYMVQSGMFNGPISTAGMKLLIYIFSCICNEWFIFLHFLDTVKYVQHGHVRIGPNVMNDPAFLVTRNHEDFITWTDTFKYKIDSYNESRDDYVD